MVYSCAVYFRHVPCTYLLTSGCHGVARFVRCRPGQSTTRDYYVSDARGRKATYSADGWAAHHSRQPSQGVHVGYMCLHHDRQCTECGLCIQFPAVLTSKVPPVFVHSALALCVR